MTTIIAFAGRKQSGKTTCAQFVNNILSTLGSVQIYNFADPLKQDICMNMLGLTYDRSLASQPVVDLEERLPAAIAV